MDQNPEVKRNSNLRRMLTIGGLIGLGALGWYFIDLVIRHHHDDRPPIIVQGGSAQIEVQFPDAKYGTKGKWEPRGSGKIKIWDHDHPGKKPAKLYNTVFPTAGCTDYDYLRSKDLTFTLASRANPAQTWEFDVRIDGNHLAVVLSDPDDFNVSNPEPSKLIVEAKVETDLVAVHARNEPSKKCTFKLVSFIQMIQLQ